MEPRHRLVPPTASPRLRRLARELADFVDAGLLDASTAERLLAHAAARRSGARATTLLAVAGSALVGLGALLLVAHNWSELPRLARAGLAVAIAVAAHGAAAFAVARRAGSAAWCEGTAIAAVLSIGASTALVAQTYQLQVELSSLLAAWTLLAVPLVYALDARAASALHALGCGAFLAATLDRDAAHPAFWALLAPGVPFAWRLHAKRDRALRSAVVAWAGIPVVAFGAAASLDGREGPLLAGAVLLAGGLYGFGSRVDRSGAPSFAALPARAFGKLAIAATALALSGADDAWSALARGWTTLDAAAVPALAIGAGCAVVVARELFAEAAGRALGTGIDATRATALALPVALAVAFAAGAATGDARAATLVASLYALGLGLVATLDGARAGALARANGGMLVAALAVFARFVDDDLSFVARGVAFIATGAAFLALNRRVARAQRVAQEVAR